jgi:hypothetical protein
MKIFKVQQVYLATIMLILSAFLIIGCSGGETGHWLPPNPDTTAPTVTAVVPLRNAIGVPRNIKKITAAFSEAMNPATLTTASFTLACPASTPVTGGGAVSYVAAGFMATLPLPSATNLPANTLCTATVTTGATDLAGNPLAANYTWTFTTGLLADNTAPTVILTVPADATAGVARNTKITATFNEDMDPSTINGTTFTVVNTTLGGTVIAGDVTYAVAARTATFTPTTPATLPASTLFTATITTGATDLAGNALVVPAVGGLPKPNPWTFTTGTGTDTTPPTVILVSPLDLAIGVCSNKTVSATFSEPMDPATITTATFTLQASGPPLGPILLGAIAYDPLTNIATFNPDADLTLNTNYTATIKGGATGVKDVTGNALAVDKVWTFKTATTTCLAPVPPGGILSPFGIASYGGISNSGATKINGNAVLDPNHFCNAVAVGSGNNFGLCGGDPPTNNSGDLVITNTYPDTTTADAVMVALLAKWNSITMAGSPGGILLGCGTIGSAGGAGLGIGCAGNHTLPPGIYISHTSSTIDITGDLILDGQGDANAVFVFQAPSAALTATPGSPGVHTRILLINGAKASNVWWEVGSSATIGGYTEFQGNVLASASISMGTSATSCGRLLAGAEGSGAFTFLGNTVSVPGHPNAPAGCQ